MDGYNERRETLERLGVSVVAASVDPEDKAREVAAGLWFPVGFGVTRAQADALGAWWEERRGIVQPSEFLLDASGKVIASSYSDGPIGRTLAEDVVRLVEFLEARKAKG